MGNFKEDIAQVEAIVLDVDGVMTDGGIIPTTDGDFVRRYNAKDGYAIAAALREGMKICVISGGRGRMLENRLTMLGVTKMYLNCMDKVAAMHEFFEEHGINPENVIYMGDDIPDYRVMQQIGLPCCPRDAAPEIRDISLYISHLDGGQGCVRDVTEQVLKAQGKWMADEKAFSW